MQLGLGEARGCAVNAAGSVRCWGVGKGIVPAQFAGVVQVVTNSTLTRARNGLGVAGCWKEGRDAPLPAGLDHVLQLAAGGVHVCALSDQGNVTCWKSGGNASTDHGQALVPTTLGQIVQGGSGAARSTARNGRYVNSQNPCPARIALESLDSVGGGTGTGKTTFANALLEVMATQTSHRLYIAEDRPELQCRAPNALFVRTVRDKYTLQAAVYDALRGRPDRIIVGELRDATALDLLKAWNTGHEGGLATIHANDTIGMLDRVCQLIQEKVYPAPRRAVAEAINDLTLDLRAPAGRRLSGVDRVLGYDRARECWLLEPL